MSIQRSARHGLCRVYCRVLYLCRISSVSSGSSGPPFSMHAANSS